MSIQPVKVAPSAPCNVEIEQAVLGLLLLNNCAFDRVSGFLESRHFYEPAHRQIFELISKTISAGRVITPATIKQRLPDDFNVAGVKIGDYLKKLAVEATSLLNVGDYSRIICDLATRRQAAGIFDQALQYITNPDADPLQLIERAENDLAKLRAGFVGSVSSHALRVTCVNDVEPEAVRWVWPGRLARGHLTLIAGAPGEGKSQITCDLAARITTGNLWPDQSRAPVGNVVMLSAEDTIKDVIRPRLEATQADLKRVHIIEAAIAKDGTERTFGLQQDLVALRKLVTNIRDVGLVVVDPITSYMGNKVDSHRMTDVRSVLEPLARFADEVDVAVLAISHPPKAPQGKAINSVTGSLAFVAAARMVFITSEEPETERRLLLSVKSNLGAKAPGLGYRMEQRTVSKGIIGSHIVWDSAPVTITADEALQRSSADNCKTVDAKELILDTLSAGTASWKALAEAGEREGISAATMRRARDQLKEANKIGCTKIGLGGWEWHIVELAKAA